MRSSDPAILAGELEGLNGDPADRIIAATAIAHGAALMTADANLLRWRHRLKRRTQMNRKKQTQSLKLSWVAGWNSSSTFTTRGERPWLWWWRRKVSSVLRFGSTP